MTIRYAAKPAHEIRNRELEATGAPTWATCLEAVYETDPDIVAAVLPKPFEAGDEPLVRLNLTQVTMPGNLVFGAGWFGVQARHGDLLGEYPLFMPMTTEQATIGGRETFGEPKKIGEVAVKRDGDRVEGHIARLGFLVAEIRGTVTGSQAAGEREAIDFYFKLSPSPEVKGALDSDPLIVHSHKQIQERSVETVDGEVLLKDSPLDPIADLPVRTLRSIVWAERASVITAKVVGTARRDDLVPFLHQRYDDLSVLGTKD